MRTLALFSFAPQQTITLTWPHEKKKENSLERLIFSVSFNVGLRKTVKMDLYSFSVHAAGKEMLL